MHLWRLDRKFVVDSPGAAMDSQAAATVFHVAVAQLEH